MAERCHKNDVRNPPSQKQLLEKPQKSRNFEIPNRWTLSNHNIENLVAIMSSLIESLVELKCLFGDEVDVITKHYHSLCEDERASQQILDSLKQNQCLDKLWNMTQILLCLSHGQAVWRDFFSQ